MIAYSVHRAPFDPDMLDGVQALLAACFDDDRLDLSSRLVGKHSPVLVLAADGHTPVGFKLGYERSAGQCYSWLGGVHPDYRRQGIARELMRQQHAWAREAGYRAVTTETENRFRAMLLLDLQEGFDIVGTYLHPSGRTRILLRKTLR